MKVRLSGAIVVTTIILILAGELARFATAQESASPTAATEKALSLPEFFQKGGTGSGRARVNPDEIGILEDGESGASISSTVLIQAAPTLSASTTAPAASTTAPAASTTAPAASTSAPAASTTEPAEISEGPETVGEGENASGSAGEVPEIENIDPDELPDTLEPGEDISGREDAFRRKFAKMSKTSIPRADSDLRLSPLHVAAMRNDLETVKELLKKGANPNEEDPDGNTALHWAVYGPIVGYALSPEQVSRLSDLIHLLIGGGAKVNAKNHALPAGSPYTLVGENTPLHYAISGRWSKDHSIINLLLDSGADPNATDSWGRTPLHKCVFWSFYDREMADILLGRGAKIDAKDDNGKTPLHWTPFFHVPEFAEFLLERGAGIETRDKAGETALHEAVRFGNEKLVRILLEKGANYNARSKRGKTPLAIASSEDKGIAMNEAAREARKSADKEIVRLLTDKGARL